MWPNRTKTGHPAGVLEGLQELVAFGQALRELIARDVKIRYKRSALGLVWTLLNPLLMMVVTTVVFSHFFRFAIWNFPIYFLSAYIVWTFFVQATQAASGSLLAGAMLLRRVYLPPALLPLASVSAAAVNLLLSLPPLLLFVLLTGGPLSWSLLSLPLALCLVAAFTYGVALVLAALSVFFHDTIHLYQVLVQLWMYVTPIFYPFEIVPAEWRPWLQLNPFFSFVRIVRDPLYFGEWPDPASVGMATLFAVGSLAVGWWYFERARHRFIAYL